MQPISCLNLHESCNSNRSKKYIVDIFAKVPVSQIGYHKIRDGQGRYMHVLAICQYISQFFELAVEYAKFRHVSNGCTCRFAEK